MLVAHPDVADAAVVGRPDPDWQNAVVAVVVAERSRRARPRRASASWCSARLAPYKVPKRFELVSELPRTGVGQAAPRRVAPADRLASAAADGRYRHD